MWCGIQSITWTFLAIFASHWLLEKSAMTTFTIRTDSIWTIFYRWWHCCIVIQHNIYLLALPGGDFNGIGWPWYEKSVVVNATNLPEIGAMRCLHGVIFLFQSSKCPSYESSRSGFRYMKTLTRRCILCFLWKLKSAWTFNIPLGVVPWIPDPK